MEPAQHLADEAPLLSVIAPNLNEKKCLPIFFECLLNQSFLDYEVIIVDGGSTDGSLQLIKQAAVVFAYHHIPFKLIVDETRNLGYVRNVGASHALGQVLFHCNTDNWFEPTLFENIMHLYTDVELASVSGRVFPMGSHVLASVAYQLFDLCRYIFNRLPFPFKKYCPSGNFCTVRSDAFCAVGGYPELSVNEDGVLGLKLSHMKTRFELKLFVGHYIKKFEQMGDVRAFLFYFYVLGNFVPFLRPYLEPIRRKAAAVFEHREEINGGLLQRFWRWL